MIIVYAGYAAGMQHALVKDHIAFGWVMFALALVPLFALGYWLQRIEGPPPEEMDAETDEASAPPSAARAGPAASSAPARAGRVLAAAALALALGAAGPAAAYWMAGAQGPVHQVRLEAPVPGGEWRGPVASRSGWQPHFSGTSGELLAAYERDGVEAGLYVAYYAHQSQNAELVNETNALYDRDRWKLRTSRDHVVQRAGGEARRVREIELVSAAGDERLLWFWYQMGDRRATSRHAAKLIQLWDTVTGTPRGAAVAVSLRPSGTMAAAREALGDFVITVAPLVDATLARAGES